MVAKTTSVTPATIKATSRRNGIKRPLIPYFGSKWRIAPQVIAHFPPHAVYVEPYGGGASVLLSKPPAPTEVYNDLNTDLVNLFAVLREQPGDLLRALRRTPTAEAEYLAAFKPTRNRVERARRLMVRAHMGFHSRAVFGEACVFKLFSSHHGNVARMFASHTRSLPLIVQRLRHVTLSCRPALRIMRDLDSPETLIYADPPYVTRTRRTGAKYQFEMQDEDHREMLDTLLSSHSMIVLSGYPNAIYDHALKGWQRISIKARVFSVSSKQPVIEEVLWINPAAQKGLKNMR